MFRSMNKNLPECGGAELPPVFCSALSASVFMDETAEQPKIVFSALSSAILDQRQEAEISARRMRKLKVVKYNCGSPADGCNDAGGRRGRRRHPAGDMSGAGKEVDEGLLEPLVGLRIQDEDAVELKTLLEEDDSFSISSQCCLVNKEKRVQPSKLRKVALTPTHVLKKLDSMEDSPDGFIRGFKTIINKIFLS